MAPGFYMHENAMDVCLEVISVSHSDLKRINVKARWWNLGYVGNPYCITPQIETITIDNADALKWHTLTNRQLHTARLAPGFPA